MTRESTLSKTLFLILLLGIVISLQVDYDHVKPAAIAGTGAGLSPGAIRMVDMGFHSTVASFLWISTMPEILDLFRGHPGYLTDLAFLTGVDPKLSYPYAFSVLTLPVIPATALPDAVAKAQAIGEQGIASADPDWRIPYYMAINYYLQMKDLKDAIWYFNLAANTPGVPSYAERFALNFGINQKDRDRVRNLWATVYESTNDPATRARAAGWVERLNDFDYLEAAAKVYRQKYGSYPASLDLLVAKGIVTAVPQDPFGFSFLIRNDGSVMVDSSKLPSYVATEPSQ